jgi:hypothetical protein
MHLACSRGKDDKREAGSVPTRYWKKMGQDREAERRLGQKGKRREDLKSRFIWN